MVKNYSFDRIKNYLTASHLVDEAKLSDVSIRAAQNKKDPEDILIESGIMTVGDFTAAKAKAFNWPVADLSAVEVPASILNILPVKAAENYQMVVFGQESKTIKVGMADPGNFLATEAIDFLIKQVGWQARYYVISLADFRHVLKQYEGSKKEITSALKSAEEKFASKEELLEFEQGGTSDERVKSAPVAKIVSVIIRNAVEGGASDIHIEPGRNESHVRYRVDGILHTSLNLPSYLHNAVVSRIKVLSNLKLDETRVPQDGRIRSKMDGQEVDLRVSVLPMLNSEKVVIRVLDTSAGVPTLAQLGFTQYHIDIIERNIKKPFGLFLLTGPTGSGKTTTLYSILNMLKGDETNITTLEDPIEYYVNGVNQSQVNPDVGFTFASGLRAILRQDPNIVMVGEIRDNETAELVIHVGLTGHLVFSTLHTNNAWGSIPRLIDMEAEPFLLASTLNLVMAQRLVRKVCPDCQEEIQLPPALLERVKKELSEVPKEYFKPETKLKFYRGKGCQTCNNTGYTGRTIIAELLEVASDLREIISKENFTSETIKAQFKKQGYITLMQDGLVKAVLGQTSVDEVMRVTQN